MGSIPTTTVGSMLVEAWQPYLTEDLEDYAHAIGAMFQEVDDLIELLGDDDEGWTKLLDPDQCPAVALPYLAMYMGERLPAGLSESMQREWIKDHPNLQRGTLVSIILAAQRSLTGTRAVMYKERTGGVPPEDYLQIRTYASQTPNPNQVIADIYTALPADIALDYATVAGQTWNQLMSAKSSWNAVKAGWPDWETMLGTLSGGDSWERPRPIP